MLLKKKPKNQTSWKFNRLLKALHAPPHNHKRLISLHSSLSHSVTHNINCSHAAEPTQPGGARCSAACGSQVASHQSLLCQLISPPAQPLCSLRNQEPPSKLKGWRPRREVRAINSCNPKALWKAVCSLMKHTRVLHRPPSPRSATRVPELIHFSDVLEQKGDVLRVLPCAARCLTHKPTCKSARTQAVHCQRQLTSEVLFVSRGEKHLQGWSWDLNVLVCEQLKSHAVMSFSDGEVSRACLGHGRPAVVLYLGQIYFRTEWKSAQIKYSSNHFFFFLTWTLTSTHPHEVFSM